MLAVSLLRLVGIIFCQNGFNLRQIGGKVDVFQLFLDAEAHFDHMGELRAQALVVAIKIIEDTGGDELMESDTGHHLADLLQGAKAAGEAMKASPSSIILVRRSGRSRADIKVGQPLVLEVLLHEEGDLHAR